jgi:hypothetical protein
MQIPTSAPRRHGLTAIFTGLVAVAITMGFGGTAAAQPTPDPATAPAVTQDAAPATRTKPTMGLKVPLSAPNDAATGAKSAAAPPVIHRNTGLNEKARNYYAAVWGVDKLRASYTNSGALIRFTYRVLQPALAAPLGDHENNPEMVGIRSNAVLHVPTMEKVGALRQMSAAVAGKEYWMVFSNKGNLVKQGDEVSVVIGKFRAEGLVVQ